MTVVPQAVDLPERLLGRAADLARAERLLADGRLVTVTGVGGVGKTTLAAAVARRHNGRQVFCSLSEALSPAAARHLVAARLGAVLPSGSSLGEALPPERDTGGVLVVLDNCEHVLAAAADMATELLAAGPHVAVLATSREPLRLAAEWVVGLGPLTVPRSALDRDAATQDAVVLFAERARAVRDDFELDDRTLPYVVDICRALDGLPLALEIAAARVRSMSVGDIAARLGERFTLVAGGRRGGPARHHGLRSVVAWSYDLLTRDEQLVFEELSVAAGCDLPAALATVAAVGTDAPALDVLDGLVAKSLLIAESAAGSTRYRMLETLRAYGVERLEARGALTTARDRHADYYADLAEQLRDLSLVEWSLRLAPLLTEFDNIRVALAWTLEHDVTAGRSFRLLAPQWYLGLQAYAEEIAQLASRALERWPDEADPRRAEVAATLAACLLTVEDVDGAARLARVAISAGTSAVAAAWGESTLAGVAMHAFDDPEQALDHLDAADAAAQLAGFEPFRCDLLGRRTAPLVQAGRREEALENAREALALAAAQDNVFEHAWGLHLVGTLLVADRPAEARDWLRQALTESLHADYFYGTASSLRGLGVAATMLGEPVEAARCFADALDRFLRTGFRLERWNTIAALLPLLRATGRQRLADDAAAAIRASGVVVERLFAPFYSRPEGADAGPGGPSGEAVVQAVRDALGQIADAAPAPAAVIPQPRREHDAALVRRGELWSATFDGTTVHLPALKGLADLVVLLARPGAEVPALDLASAYAAPAPAPAAAELVGAPGDLGETVDAQARAAYAVRIRELQDEVDAADGTGDAARAERAQVELDALTQHLAAAYGLHGPRRAGDPAEKARTAVTARVRAAIGKIADAHPALGRHLVHSVRTGRFCSYQPDEPTTWLLDP